MNHLTLRFISALPHLKSFYTRAPITDSVQCESKNLQKATNAVLDYCAIYGIAAQMQTSSNSIATALRSIQSQYPLLHRVLVSMLHPEESQRPSMQEVKRSAYYLLQ